MPDLTADDQIDPLVQPPQNPADLMPWANAAGVPQMVQALGRGLYGLAELPKKAIEASENYRTTGDYNAGPMVDLVTTLAGGGMPAAEKGAAGIFGGKLSRTADLTELANAQRAWRGGASPTSIWRQHGWAPGAEGVWRYEIPDQGMIYDPSDYHGLFGPPPTVGHALHHPELMKAYPDLANIPLKWDEGVYHSPWPGHEEIGLNTDTGPGSVAHELEHAVQWREGFAPGTNKKTMMGYADQALQGLNIPREPVGDYSNLTENVAYQAYLRHAGEVEARNVANRLSNPEFVNRYNPPWTTEDVARPRQIIRPPNEESPYGGPYGEMAQALYGHGNNARAESLTLKPRELTTKEPGPSEYYSPTTDPVGFNDYLHGVMGGGKHSFDIANGQGQNVARMWASQPEKGQVYVNYITGLDAKGNPRGIHDPEAPNALGPSEIRSLLPELAKAFPGAKEVAGLRETGARPYPEHTSVKLPKAKE